MSGFGPAFHSSTVVVFVAPALVLAPAAPAAYVQRRPRSVPRPESGSPYGEHRVRALPRTIKLTTGRPAAAKGTRPWQCKGTRPWPHRRDAPAPPGSSAAPLRSRPHRRPLPHPLGVRRRQQRDRRVAGRPGGPEHLHSRHLRRTWLSHCADSGYIALIAPPWPPRSTANVRAGHHGPPRLTQQPGPTRTREARKGLPRAGRSIRAQEIHRDGTAEQIPEITASPGHADAFRGAKKHPPKLRFRRSEGVYCGA